ncbi:MAG: hypothetical protein JSS86_19865 [Cyanobacteria bacterium SZAS LIN-2]|nr:hypothetical protein [Cyanobacteria bacterium SZAS LIN-3]MBS1998596.1 hypothetical protein [Cyanobacteria bacterium SZAS LIN-2]MBS2011218.1 hypothetical protein [Cyanobacteria bacterium SZAS TMP-1]
MAKGKSRPVQTKKPKDGLKDGRIHVGVITVEQQRKMRLAREREERIASGLKQTGGGFHEEQDKSKRNRKERRKWKQGANTEF